VHADAIMVMKDGRIIEQGTHESLLMKGGEYHTLWDEQLKKDQESRKEAHAEI
jgi:ATP-binding cassette subfamily B protein